MVVTMFVQQLLAPTSADPNQKKMMLAMPFIMLFFMYDMPAGLTLYWTVSQLLSIVQQHFTNKSLKTR
jgi:YidC/Oxa1 family membrane protein insertase